MFDISKILGVFSKYADTIGNVVQGVSAVRSYMNDRAAERSTRRANQAAMEAANAEAALTRQDAAQRADAARREAQRFRARQISTFLKSGITLDGSPMLVSDETSFMGDRDAANILTNADYSARSMVLRGQANQQAVKKADLFGTAFSVLGSAAKAKQAYDKANKPPTKRTGHRVEDNGTG